MTINLPINKHHRDFLSQFKKHTQVEMVGYNPIAWELEYYGVLLTTNLTNGKYSDKTWYVLSGVGKEIMKQL